MNIHDVQNQSINEQERAVLERCVNSILYLHKKQQKCDSKVWTYHCSISIEYIYLYQNFTDICVLISSNLIRNEADKTFELNKLTVWYVTAAPGFMGWYVAFLIKDFRYFCCSSKVNLMKVNFSFGQFPKQI